MTPLFTNSGGSHETAHEPPCRRRSGQ